MTELKFYTASWARDPGDGSMLGKQRTATVVASSRAHALSKIMGNVLDQMSLMMTFDREFTDGIFDHTFLLWVESPCYD